MQADAAVLALELSFSDLQLSVLKKQGSSLNDVDMMDSMKSIRTSGFVLTRRS